MRPRKPKTIAEPNAREVVLKAEYALGLKPSCIFCVQTRVHIFHMSQHSVSNHSMWNINTRIA